MRVISEVSFIGLQYQYKHDLVGIQLMGSVCYEFSRV